VSPCAVHLQEMNPAMQVEALLGERVDVGFVRAIHEPALAAQTVLEEPILAALPSGHRLGRHKRRGTADWLASATSSFVYGVSQWLEDTFIPKGLTDPAGCSGRRAHSRDIPTRQVTPSLCSDLSSDRERSNVKPKTAIRCSPSTTFGHNNTLGTRDTLTRQ
jgi:hypothetical protein